MKKTILIDAVGCLVDSKGKINYKLENLIKKFNNHKIVLTNANDKEIKIFLKNIKHKIFSLKHNPNKPSLEYYQKFLKSNKLKANQVIYFEHDLKAVNSAKKNKIVTHHFDGNIKKLEKFLFFNLNKN